MTYTKTGRRLLPGEVQREPTETLAACYPSVELVECRVCKRHRPGVPPETRRRAPVIDATVLKREGICEMWRRL